jgi:hypothetical protein
MVALLFWKQVPECLGGSSPLTLTKFHSRIANMSGSSSVWLEYSFRIRGVASSNLASLTKVSEARWTYPSA